MLLWDLDNLSTSAGRIQDLATLMGRFGGPDTERFAAGHQVICRSHGAFARQAGFEVRSAGRRRQGADRLLLRHATDLATRGVKYFCVGSSDGAFASIGELGHLVVITMDASRVSRRLSAAADAMLEVAKDSSGWRVHYVNGLPIAEC